MVLNVGVLPVGSSGRLNKIKVVLEETELLVAFNAKYDPGMSNELG